VTVTRRTSTYTLLRLDFGSNLAAGASRKLTLTFDLKDPGGAPDRPIRISPSLVSFYAWAFATPATPGSSVSIVFPAGYAVTVGRGPLTGPTAGPRGLQTWTSGPLADPLSFVADLTADRPTDYVDAPMTVPVGGVPANLVIRSWPDDAPWRTRVGDLVAVALPVLGDAIGQPWPIADPLVIQEALPRSTGGYAGLFDPSQHRIEIAYAAPAGVILHEAAHAWFNGGLVADRWVAEAFASYYAQVAAARLGLTIESPELDDANRLAAIPLNAWGAIGSASQDVEAYSYAASLELARAIGARAGPDGLQRLWALAARRIGAYQPAAGPAETVTEAPDWRGLLDLLEDATGKSYLDLWRTWVVRPADLSALDARTEARAAYQQAMADAGAWVLPRSIRDAMRTWQFDVAELTLTNAEAILRQRTALEREAAGANLQLPTTLRSDFEGGDLVQAGSEAAAELATVGRIEAAAETRLVAPNVLESIGLLGGSPDADLAAARAAFASGRLQDAADDADRAAHAWQTATTSGQARIVSTILLLASGVLLLSLMVGLRRRGGRGRPA
jgi:hypothetical protein